MSDRLSESLKESLLATVDAIVEAAVEHERLECMKLCVSVTDRMGEKYKYGANLVWHGIDERRRK